MPQSDFVKRLPGSAKESLPIDYSVQFGDPKRNYGMKAYPFFYNFIKSPYQIGSDDSFGATQETGIYRVTSDAAEGPDGLTLVAGGILDIPIVMDNDTNFHMLYTKYGAFRINNFTVVTTDAGDTLAQPLTDPFVNDNRIIIDTLTSTTGPIVGVAYFVISAGATTFQISLTSGGAAIALTTNGTAALRRLGGVAGSRDYLLYPVTNIIPDVGIAQFNVPANQTGAVLTQPPNAPFTNGDRVNIDVLFGVAVLAVNVVYFVISASATTFQLSLTSGGAAVILTTSIATPYVALRKFNNAGVYNGQNLLPLTIDGPRIPYWTDLDASMYMPSSQNRDIYGGFQRQPIGGAVEEAPIPILNLQGAQDGLGMLKAAFQLTKSATVWIRIRSRSAFPLQVYGHIFGYKITA